MVECTPKRSFAVAERAPPPGNFADQFHHDFGCVPPDPAEAEVWDIALKLERSEFAMIAATLPELTAVPDDRNGR